MNDKMVIEGKRQTVVPEGTKCLTADMIDNKYEIEELYLPNTVEKVGTKALEDLTRLRKLTMPAKFLKVYDEDDAWRIHNQGFNTSAVFFTFFHPRRLPSTLEEIVVYGDEVEMDLSRIDWEHFMSYSPKTKRVLRIANEVVAVKLPVDVSKNYCPDIYMNNTVENVDVSAATRWTLDKFYFRAPKPNERELDANAIELTMAPKETYRDAGAPWNCPITINCSAVSYIAPVEICCYESDKYPGSELLLLGERLDEEALADLHLGDYPRVVVWEDKETVYNKLVAKNW